jgi:hypothetical protein
MGINNYLDNIQREISESIFCKGKIRSLENLIHRAQENIEFYMEYKAKCRKEEFKENVKSCEQSNEKKIVIWKQKKNLWEQQLKQLKQKC